MRTKLFVLILSLVSSVSMAQSISAVIVPRFIQGVGNYNLADERRVPFASRLTVNGLTPNATYRYYNRFVYDTTDQVTQGEGNYILVKDSGSFVRSAVPSLATPGSYGEFKANAAGSYTGWFVAEPDVSFIFEPTAILYMRLILNDGAGGAFIAHKLTVTSAPVEVINFGSAAGNGTALRATPLNKGIDKQFVFLYDNLSAGGRPVAGTFIESDGTANTVANGYAPFYADSVNGVARAFGTIVPNNLPNGIQRIDQFRLTDGAFVRSYFPYPVIESWSPLTIGLRWPSVNNTLIDTRNPTGGLTNVLVIDGAPVLGINLWIGENSTEDLLTLQWNTPAEVEAVAYAVEKSTDAGKTFVPVQQIRKGVNKQFYELKTTREEATAHYRVVMTSKDGARTVSEVLKVDGVIKLQVSPNPVPDQLLVRHPLAGRGATVQVVSVDGRRLSLQNVADGAVQTTINVRQLLPGSYFVVYSVDGRRQSKRFIKQ